MPGFVERLKEELDKASTPGASMLASVIPHPTAHEPGYNAQRKHASWIGGSMLASLSPFKQVRTVVGVLTKVEAVYASVRDVFVGGFPNVGLERKPGF